MNSDDTYRIAIMREICARMGVARNGWTEVSYVNGDPRQGLTGQPVQGMNETGDRDPCFAHRSTGDLARDLIRGKGSRFFGSVRIKLVGGDPVQCLISTQDMEDLEG